jgi:hypothetical protein
VAEERNQEKKGIKLKLQKAIFIPREHSNAGLLKRN